MELSPIELIRKYGEAFFERLRNGSNGIAEAATGSVTVGLGLSALETEKVMEEGLAGVRPAGLDGSKDPSGVLMRATNFAEVDFAPVAWKADPNSADDDGNTALCKIIARNDLDAVSCLLLAGADPDKESGRAGTRPLIAAVNAENVELVVLLVRHKADPKKTDRFGNDAFHYAKNKGQEMLNALNGIDYIVPRRYTRLVPTIISSYNSLSTLAARGYVRALLDEWPFLHESERKIIMDAVLKVLNSTIAREFARLVDIGDSRYEDMVKRFVSVAKVGESNFSRALLPRIYGTIYDKLLAE